MFLTDFVRNNLRDGIISDIKGVTENVGLIPIDSPGDLSIEPHI
jgi:hypothetical protein